MAKKRKTKAKAKRATRAAPKRKKTLRKAKSRTKAEVHTGPGSGVFPLLQDLFGGMDRGRKR